MADTERLAALLYRLARDEVPFGAIENHVRVVEAAHLAGEPVSYVGEASPMGEWARRTAKRLVHEAERKPDEVDSGA